MHEQGTELEIAWAAGLFEGEGWLSSYQREYGAKIQPQIGLASTDRDVVERFHRVVGCGAISTQKPGTGGHKPCHAWRVYEAEQVRRVIALFMSYFGERRRETAVALLDRIADVRSHNAKKTHCPRNHALSGANLIEEAIRGGKYIARRCRTCRNEQARLRALQAKEAA